MLLPWKLPLSLASNWQRAVLVGDRGQLLGCLAWDDTLALGTGSRSLHRDDLDGRVFLDGRGHDTLWFLADLGSHAGSGLRLYLVVNGIVGGASLSWHVLARASLWIQNLSVPFLLI